MIWCFGFFFLELLDDCDEESNKDDALASLDDAGRKLGSDSDTVPGDLDKRIYDVYLSKLTPVITCIYNVIEK